MQYEPYTPDLDLDPQAQQVVYAPVEARSSHRWRIYNNTANVQQVRVRCTLRDNLGNTADSYDDTSQYQPGQEYIYGAELQASVEDGYARPMTVTWMAETVITVVSLPLPPKRSGKARVIKIINDPNFRKDLVLQEQDEERLFDPETSNYLQVQDATEKFQELSKNYEPSEEENQKFLKHRQQLLEKNSRPFTAVSFLDDPLPPPGGVGQGIMLKDGRLDFNTFTGIYFYIVTPRYLGGSSPELIYLTSSNRANKGCEALVSYQGRDGEAVFRIWDWATPPKPNGTHWVVGTGYGDLDDYLIKYQLGEHNDLNVLYVVNITRKVGQNKWQNEVYLHNKTTGTRDRVWQYRFDWALPTDPAQKYMHWGPIVETFAQEYGETNYVGFAQSLMVQDGSEHQLDDSNSFIRSDGHGFSIEYLVHNHTFLAR